MLKGIMALAVLAALAQPVANTAKASAFYTKKELKCLVDNIYYEARGESLMGQVAVAKVTLNRAKESSICKEVYRPFQFSWTHQGVSKVKDAAAYAVAWQAAHLAQFTTFTATHYHAVSVRPGWSKRLTKLTQIGNHVFYEQIQSS